MEDPWESNPTAPPMARKRLAGVPDPGAKAAELVFAALEWWDVLRCGDFTRSSSCVYWYFLRERDYTKYHSSVICPKDRVVWSLMIVYLDIVCGWGCFFAHSCTQNKSSNVCIFIDDYGFAHPLCTWISWNQLCTWPWENWTCMFVNACSYPTRHLSGTQIKSPANQKGK